MKIIIVEDDLGIGHILQRLLESHYGTVLWFKSAEEIYTINELENWDIALIDVMLPGDNGFEVLKWIRKNNPDMGAIMLTAKSSNDDKVHGLLIGADDYITKPFNSKELIARIDALYRKVSKIKAQTPHAEHLLKYGLNADNGTFEWQGKKISLTQIETGLLISLISHKDRVVSRDQLLDEVWGVSYYGSVKVVDVNVQRIRKKVSEDIIATRWGKGYQWNA